ncbi:zinc finger protein-like [Tropilaelaps mercedesae]|uniref:Zinc finger protein-like n=1 Tax=Tropilaelaps mercedesae TaxID=418985 RepID=A0A1V9XU23_9ACAR|nr:zinc finger protein-like [Tropilaelaps mercedesae]
MHLHCKGGVRNIDGAFSCSFCPYQGKTAGQMKKHFYHRHATVKPLQCSYCPRRFVRSEHLKRHERSRHTKEKPYSCVLCGRLFASNAVLYQHQVAKHGRLTRNVQRLDDTHLNTHMSWSADDLIESREPIVGVAQEHNP